MMHTFTDKSNTNSEGRASVLSLNLQSCHHKKVHHKEISQIYSVKNNFLINSKKINPLLNKSQTAESW
jgi:hypothetical protein